MRSSFFLSKWYFDCVSDDGNVFISYIAEARWGSISISYSSTLQHRHGRKVETSTSLRRSAAPQVAGSDIRWVSPRLNVAGQWTAMASVLVGLIVTMMDNSPVAPTPEFGWLSLVAALAFGVSAWFALGVDFPNSKRRFARLA